MKKGCKKCVTREGACKIIIIKKKLVIHGCRVTLADALSEAKTIFQTILL